MSSASSAPLATTVYVGGLPPNVHPEALAAAFPFAAVHAVVVRSFGFVTFATADEAHEAANYVCDVQKDVKEEKRESATPARRNDVMLALGHRNGGERESEEREKRESKRKEMSDVE